MFYERHDDAVETGARSSQIVALWRCWRDKAGDGLPPYALFSPETLGDFAENISVSLYLGGDDLIFTYLGAARTKAFQRDFTGVSVKSIKSSLGAFLHKHFLESVETGKPLFLYHSATRLEKAHLTERLILPCRDDDGNILVVSVSCPRNFDEDMLSAVLEAAHEGIWAVRSIRDEHGQITDFRTMVINRRVAKVFGKDYERLVMMSLLEVFPKLRRAKQWPMLVEAVNTRQPLSGELAYRRRGETIWLKANVSPLGDGAVMFFRSITDEKRREQEKKRQQEELEAANAALAHEIARRKDVEEELRRMADHDHLTGLRNRRSLETAMASALSLAGRYGQAVSLIAVDLDAFKAINDLHGHAGGDVVLKTAAKLFHYAMREDVDVIGRVGGEEFSCVLPATSLQGAVTVAERLRRTFSESHPEGPKGEPIAFTASFGVVEWDGQENVERLAQRADAALYRAKAAGRNCVVVDTGGGKFVTVRENANSEAPSAPSLTPQRNVEPLPPSTIEPSLDPDTPLPVADLGSLFNLKGLI